MLPLPALGSSTDIPGLDFRGFDHVRHNRRRRGEVTGDFAADQGTLRLSQLALRGRFSFGAR